MLMIYLYRGDMGWGGEVLMNTLLLWGLRSYLVLLHLNINGWEYMPPPSSSDKSIDNYFWTWIVQCFVVKMIGLIDWVRVKHPVSMLAAIWDTHVMDMRCAVCGFSSWSPAQEVTSDRGSLLLMHYIILLLWLPKTQGCDNRSFFD